MKFLLIFLLLKEKVHKSNLKFLNFMHSNDSNSSDLENNRQFRSKSFTIKFTYNLRLPFYGSNRNNWNRSGESGDRREINRINLNKRTTLKRVFKRVFIYTYEFHGCRLAKEFTRQHQVIISGSDKANPIKTYLLIRSLTSDWNSVERLMKNNSVDYFLRKNITKQNFEVILLIFFVAYYII